MELIIDVVRFVRDNIMQILSVGFCCSLLLIWLYYLTGNDIFNALAVVAFFPLPLCVALYAKELLRRRLQDTKIEANWDVIHAADSWLSEIKRSRYKQQ